jgi:hypothetical protein
MWRDWSVLQYGIRKTEVIRETPEKLDRWQRARYHSNEGVE